MEWTLASKAEYDALKTLGNTGWDWDSMVPYFKKAQSRIAQPDNPIFPGSGSASGPTIGTSGPVKVSIL
jgi:choline dehydrogenase-like flavoprotein